MQLDTLNIQSPLRLVPRHMSDALLLIGVIAILSSGLVIIFGCQTLARAETQTLQAGQTFRDCSDCPEMVVIPAGSFVMGSSAEETARELASMPGDEPAVNGRSLEWEHPQHSVTIARSFALGKYQVTRGEFATFVRATGYSTGTCTLFPFRKFLHVEGTWQNPGFTQSDRDPAVCVNWHDATAYVAWLNGKLHGEVSADNGGPYRLPSDAEYEYAARAGRQARYWWGDAIGSGNAVCDDCGSAWDNQQPAPVGSFRPNPFGLYDMLGNAWAWIEDCWNENYVGAPTDGREWMSGKCEQRVIRAGSWSNRPWTLRTAHRRGGSQV